MRMLPGVYQLINGDVSVSKLKQVEIEDLLGRELVQINTEEVLNYVRGKTILVTGGAGLSAVSYAGRLRLTIRNSWLFWIFMKTMPIRFSRS